MRHDSFRIGPAGNLRLARAKNSFPVCAFGGLRRQVRSFFFRRFSILQPTVDEQAHFDLVTRYSNGEFRALWDPPHEEALPYLAFSIHRNISGRPTPFQTAKIPGPPPWTLDRVCNQASCPGGGNGVEKKVPNHEASQTPLYYTPGGFMVAAGKGRWSA